MLSMSLFTAYTRVDLEPEDTDATAPLPLYKAVLPKIFQVGKGVKRASMVGIRWFKIGGLRKPRIEYRQFIRDYDELSRDQQAVMEEVVDETFSHEESEALQRFLHAREDWDGSLTLAEFYMPVSFLDDPEVGRVTRSFQSAMHHLTPGYAVVLLAEAPGYDFEFQVGGYYHSTGLPSDCVLPWLRSGKEKTASTPPDARS